MINATMKTGVLKWSRGAATVNSDLRLCVLVFKAHDNEWQ